MRGRLSHCPPLFVLPLRTCPLPVSSPLLVLPSLPIPLHFLPLLALLLLTHPLLAFSLACLLTSVCPLLLVSSLRSGVIPSVTLPHTTPHPQNHGKNTHKHPLKHHTNLTQPSPSPPRHNGATNYDIKMCITNFAKRGNTEPRRQFPFIRETSL